MKTPSNVRDTRNLALVGACLVSLALGCDPDAMQRPVGDADADDEQATVSNQRLMDTLQRSNARIDMAAREALVSAKEYEAQARAQEAGPTLVPDATHEGSDDEVARNAEADRDEFVAHSQERLRRMRLELERIHARTDRRIDELDANLEQDRQRAEARLERLIDASQEGYVQARDAVNQELRELEARLQVLRERIDDAV